MYQTFALRALCKILADIYKQILDTKETFKLCACQQRTLKFPLSISFHIQINALQPKYANPIHPLNLLLHPIHHAPIRYQS